MTKHRAGHRQGRGVGGAHGGSSPDEKGVSHKLFCLSLDKTNSNFN